MKAKHYFAVAVGLAVAAAPYLTALIPHLPGRYQALASALIAFLIGSKGAATVPPGMQTVQSMPPGTEQSAVPRPKD